MKVDGWTLHRGRAGAYYAFSRRGSVSIRHRGDEKMTAQAFEAHVRLGFVSSPDMQWDNATIVAAWDAKRRR